MWSSPNDRTTERPSDPVPNDLRIWSDRWFIAGSSATDCPCMEDLVSQLILKRSRHCFPVGIQSNTRGFAHSVLAVLFPHFSETLRCDEAEITAEVHSVKAQLQALMTSLADHFKVPEKA